MFKVDGNGLLLQVKGSESRTSVDHHIIHHDAPGTIADSMAIKDHADNTKSSITDNCI